MSDAVVIVRFEDGALLYGRYHGCGDMVMNPLTTNPFRAMEWRDDNQGTPKKEEPVEICSTYGETSVWKGTACYETRQVIKGIAPFDEDLDIKEGVPEWAKEVDSLYCKPRSVR